MPEHLGAQHGAKTLAGFCRAVLADQRTAQTDKAEQHHHAAHSNHISSVAVGDTDVDDLCHNQRHDQFEDGLGQFKYRANQHL